MAEQSLIETFLRSLNIELPIRDTLDEYLDIIIPSVRKWGEDLGETKYYSKEGGKPWLEFRDQDNFHNTILHFFNVGGEYLKSTDGNVIKGKWRLLEGTNKLIIEIGDLEKGGTAELFELAYLDSNFFILRKHGEQPGRRKYTSLGYEPYIQGLEWRDYAEALFSTYRNKARTYQIVAAVVIIVIAAAVAASIF